MNSMVRLQRRISEGQKVLQYFTTKEWVFYNDKLIELQNGLSPIEKKIFQFLIYDMKISEYIKNSILGARQYCMKEDLSTLPKARRHQKM